MMISRWAYAHNELVEVERQLYPIEMMTMFEKPYRLKEVYWVKYVDGRIGWKFAENLVWV